MEADSPLGVGGSGVFEETRDRVGVCLVDEEATVFGGVLDLECAGAMNVCVFSDFVRVGW